MFARILSARLVTDAAVDTDLQSAGRTNDVDRILRGARICAACLPQAAQRAKRRENALADALEAAGIVFRRELYVRACAHGDRSARVDFVVDWTPPPDDTAGDEPPEGFPLVLVECDEHAHQRGDYAACDGARMLRVVGDLALGHMLVEDGDAPEDDEAPRPVPGAFRSVVWLRFNPAPDTGTPECSRRLAALVARIRERFWGRHVAAFRVEHLFFPTAPDGRPVGVAHYPPEVQSACC